MEDSTSFARSRRRPLIGQRVKVIRGQHQGMVGLLYSYSEETGVCEVSTPTFHPDTVEQFAIKDLMWVDEPTPNLDEPTLDVLVSFTDHIVRELARHPSRLHELPPRRFEELVAELLRDMGYAVRLTPQTRDGGRDILAVLKTPAGDDLLTVVECKRFAPDHVVGIDIVERFLWVIEHKDRANAGLIATTSHFSKGAEALRQQFSYRLTFRDQSGLQEWLARYGTWDREAPGKLWRPNTRL